jgi:hypothetical protein
VDQGSCPVARIGLWKSEDGLTEAVWSISDEAPIEKLTEDATDYADPGWQDDKKKRYPLDTEEHVRAAASYFGRPRNRKKYSADQQKKIDAKIEAAKKKFKIGEYADKSDGSLALCKYDSNGGYNPVDWISLASPLCDSVQNFLIVLVREVIRPTINIAQLVRIPAGRVSHWLKSLRWQTLCCLIGGKCRHQFPPRR